MLATLLCSHCLPPGDLYLPNRETRETGPYRNTTTTRIRGSPSPWLLTLAALLLATPAFPQESIRLSLASSQAAEARRQAASTLGYYNVKLGPSAWRFAAGLGMAYDTNIRLDPDELAKSDFMFTPEVDARMLWPITDQNSLNLRLGGGYNAYTRYTEFNRWFINPGSELSFDIYVGNFWINLHDRFTITTDNYQDPTAVGIGDYSQFQNDAGFGVVWDLNKLVTRLGYDHLNYIILNGYQGQPDARQEVLSLAGGYPFQKDSELGLEIGTGFMHYDTSGTNTLYTDAIQWNIGPYVDLQLTDYIRGHLSVGYTMFMPDAPGLDDFTGIYAQLGFSHRINQYVSYNLGGSRSVQFALFGGTIDLYTASLTANWHILREFTLSTGFLYEHGDYLDLYVETFDRYGPNVTLSRRITEKLTASLEYQYFNRSSDVPNWTYQVHIVSLNLRYQF
jgi:hypothetical protein